MAQRDDDQQVTTEVASSDAVTGTMGAGSSEGDASTGEKGKRKARPRLTVQPDVMRRLRAMATEREMTASELAEELLSKFLSNIPEEEDELIIEGEDEGQSSKVDSTSDSKQ